jgi:hypothetical protein
MVDIPSKPKKKKLKWKRAPYCSYNMTETIKKVLDKNNIKETSGDDWTIYIPCSYNYTNKEIKDAQKNIKNKDQRIFIINNADDITNKCSIWNHLVNKYGRHTSSQLMPKTYCLNSKDDMHLFNIEYDPKKYYILKKNIQRQEGLKITNDKKVILNAKNDAFVVVQELLQNPYIIGGRKTNMRFYLLLVCRYGEISAYVHNEGFMYYTKVLFKKGDPSDDNNITTGYIDRKVYEKNPLTLGDLRKYLDDPNRKMYPDELLLVQQKQKISIVVMNRIYELLTKLVNAMNLIVCSKDKISENLTFQLFGIDIALNDQLIPQIIEANKGPDLGAKDGRDGDVKRGVVTDIFRIINTIDGPNNFVKLF